MGKLEISHKSLLNALDTLEKAIEYFDKIEHKTQEPISFLKYEDLRRAFRDSLIQRFEFSTDLFWKYIKSYLEVSLKLQPLNGPKPVIKSACKANLITEEDTQNILEMIDCRNLTSHIYREEIADQVCLKISKYYQLMRKYAKKLTPNSDPR